MMLLMKDCLEAEGTEANIIVDLFLRLHSMENVCCLYHQKNDFISVPYEPKDAECLKK